LPLDIGEQLDAPNAGKQLWFRAIRGLVTPLFLHQDLVIPSTDLAGGQTPAPLV